MNYPMKESFYYFVIVFVLALWPAIVNAEDGAIISLEDAYRLALQSHEDILGAGIDIDKSALISKKVISLLSPNISVSGDYSRPKNAILFDSSAVIPGEKWTETVTVTQQLYNPRLLPAYRLGRHSMDASKETYMLTVRDVLFEVARVYYSVLKNEESITIARDSIFLAQEELKVAQEKYHAGEVPQTDVLRAEVEVSRAERQLVEAENTLFSSNALLSAMIGMETKGGYSLKKPAEMNMVIERPEGLIETAIGRRNDLKEGLINIDIAKDNEKLTLAEFQPELKLEWSDYWVDPETFSQKNDLWMMTVSVSMPIFEGGLRSINLKEKKMETRQSHLKYERLKKDIETEVKNSYYEAQTLKSVLAALTKEAELARQTYEITGERYSNGQSSSIDLMDALTRFNSVRVELSAKSYEYQIALLDLQRVTGTFAEEYVNFSKRGVQ